MLSAEIFTQHAKYYYILCEIFWTKQRRIKLLLLCIIYVLEQNNSKTVFNIFLPDSNGILS